MDCFLSVRFYDSNNIEERQKKIMGHCFLLTRRGWDDIGFDHEMKLKPR